MKCLSSAGIKLSVYISLYISPNLNRNCYNSMVNRNFLKFLKVYFESYALELIIINTNILLSLILLAKS